MFVYMKKQQLPVLQGGTSSFQALEGLALLAARISPQRCQLRLGNPTGSRCSSNLSYFEHAMAHDDALWTGRTLLRDGELFP